jgi:hypothetical protein
MYENTVFMSTSTTDQIIVDHKWLRMLAAVWTMSVSNIAFFVPKGFRQGDRLVLVRTPALNTSL